MSYVFSDVVSNLVNNLDNNEVSIILYNMVRNLVSNLVSNPRQMAATYYTKAYLFNQSQAFNRECSKTSKMVIRIKDLVQQY